VTVGYLDSNRGASLTYDAAGQSYSILGSRASDKFVILDDSRTTSIDGGEGEDLIRFGSTVAATHSGATTTAIRADLSTFAMTNVENMTGQVSLGAGLRNEIVEAVGKWNSVATQFIAGESAAARIPFLGLSLVEAFGRGFSATPPVDVAAAKSFAADLFTLDASSITGLFDLAALSSQLQTQFDASSPGSPFRVTAGIYDWSELRVDVAFDASRTFESTPSPSDADASALTAAGFELSAMSDVTVEARVDGSLQFGIRLDGLNTLSGASGFADRGFLRVNPLTVSVDIDATDLSASVGLSGQVFGTAANITIVDGAVSLRAKTEFSLDSASADGSGRFSLDAIPATPSIHAVVSGALEARLPLGATLGNFDLSQYGTPTVILSTDRLFEYQDGVLLITTPAVSLDVAIKPALALRLLDLLSQVRDLGDKLPLDLFNREIPGLGQSLNQLLTNSQSSADPSGLGGTFKLKDAAGHYFYLDYDSSTGTGSTWNLNLSIRGFLDAVNRALSSLTQVKFSLGSFDWSGKNLAGFDFGAFRIAHGLNFDFLRGFNFSGADLRGVNFSGLDLTATDFSGARFDGTTNFSGAWLRKADFSGADVRGVDFSGLDLRWASFSGAWLDFAKFNFSLAFDVDWSNVRFSTGSRPSTTNLLTGADLTSLFGSSGVSSWKRLAFGLDLSGWSLKNWIRFDLSGLDFSGVNLSGFNFSGANLRGASFHGGTLDNANFGGAFGWDINWGSLFSSLNVNISNFLTNISLPSWGSSTGTAKSWASGLDLSGFDFSGWDLSGIDFTGITFAGASFRGTRMAGAKLPSYDSGLDFSFADFRGIDFSGISSLRGLFRGVNFSGLNFSGISFDVGSLDFSGANFDGSLNLSGLFSGLSLNLRRSFDGANFGG
ncbi:MAG TPA: pentapeptide repeat-containing protein, partial [Pirellulaceae bacterium]|nr:pentapeptide repeat-containing protein [Pirellulaceae bacterium]